MLEIAGGIIIAVFVLAFIEPIIYLLTWGTILFVAYCVVMGLR